MKHKMKSLKTKYRRLGRKLTTHTSQEVCLLLVPILLIIAISLFISYKIVLTDGLIMHRDFASPLSTERHEALYYPLWNPYGSTSNFEQLSRIALMGPLLITASVLEISMGVFIKGMLIGNLILIGLSMYFAANIIIKEVYKNINGKIVFTASMISALIYMFNPWSMDRIVHFFIWTSYALAPLILVSFMKSLQSGKLRYIITTAFLWCLASTSPTFIILIGVLIFSWLTYSVFVDARKLNLLKSIKVTSLTVIFYIAFSSYWIVPYLMATFTVAPLKPTYVVTHEVIDMISRNSDLLNTIRLMGSWWPQVSYQPSPQILHTPWLVASFIMPLTAFAALLLKPRNRYVIYFTLMGILFMFLGMGTRSPLPLIYNWLVFDAPLSDALGWVFREPDRWNGLLALMYSFLIGLTISGLFQSNFFGKAKKVLTTNRRKLGYILGITLFVSSFALYTGPTVSGYLNDIYVPIEIPKEYCAINDWLANNPENFKVLWLPTYMGHATTWAPDRVIGPFNVISSAKPTIGPFTLYAAHFRNYIYESLLNDRTANFGKYLDFLNTRYVLFHDDIIGAEMEGEIATRNLEDQRDLEFIKQEGFIHVFKNEHHSPPIFVPTQSFLVIGGLNTFTSLGFVENFRPGDSALIFLEQKWCGASSNVGDIIVSTSKLESLAIGFADEKHVITPFDYTDHHNPSRLWSKAGATDPLHGPWRPYLEQRGIRNWDFDYGEGLVFTWAPSVLEEPLALNREDLLAQYSFEDSLEGWSINAPNVRKMFLSDVSYRGKHSLGIELENSTWGWKTINSPMVPVEYGNWYRWEFEVKGQNSHAVHAKIRELDADGNYLGHQLHVGIGDGTFDWKTIGFDYSPSSLEVTYMQLEIWHDHETPKPLPNKIWMDEVKVYCLRAYLKPNSLDVPFKVDKDGSYELFIRYFQNEDGGEIIVELDGENISVLNTKDQINEFSWNHLGTFDLLKCKHILTIQNRSGFNAVNIFALIPSGEYQRIESEIQNLLENKRIVYVLEAESDLYRENSRILKSEEASNGEVVALGESTRVWRNVEIVKEGMYRLAVMLSGSASVEIGDEGFQLNSEQLNFVYSDSIYLEQGSHMIEIKTPENKDAHLDVIWLYSLEREDETLDDVFSVGKHPAEVISYERIDPTKYVVRVKAEKPFMLSFAESYDPLWAAYVNGKEYKSMPLYSVVNGFWIDETGELEVTIKYKPQRWFYYGSIISVTTLLACLTYLTYNWTKNKAIWKRTRES